MSFSSEEGKSVKRKRVTMNQDEENTSSDDFKDCAQLSFLDANWFLEVLEEANMMNLPLEHREFIQNTKLRSKIKHRGAVLFSDDVEFLFNNNFRLYASGQPGSMTCGKLIVEEICVRLCSSFGQSIEIKATRSCIWSALLDRCMYFLQKAQVKQAKLVRNRNCETALEIFEYRISRSNFRKLLLGHFTTRKREMVNNNR